MKEYDWVQPTLERLSDLLKMPDAHNSYGTPKVDPGCAWAAVRTIAWTGVPMLPVPTVHPTMDGGLGFTWYGPETECTMTISPGISAGVFNFNVGARKGAVIRDFGGFSGPRDRLMEILGEISRELSPVEKAL